MVKIQSKSYRLPSFFMTLFTIFFFFVFIVLGAWQVQRYHYKQRVENNFQQRLHATPVPLAKALQYQEKQFLPVIVHGHYLADKNLLLQNRFYHDQLGQEVITPYWVSSQQRILLIDRGWIAQTAINREYLSPPTNDQTVIGYIKNIDYQFTLGKNILFPQQWPLVMQKVNIKELSQLTHWRIYPFLLHLRQDQAGGFVRDWQPLTLSPQRSLGYAIQWFAMALVLAGAYVFFCCNKS